MLSKSWPEVKLGAANSRVKEEDSRKEWSAVRADALSSAIYYSECTLSKVSEDRALHAKEIASEKQSKWWLPGNNPDHPSLQSPGSMPIVTSSCPVIERDCIDAAAATSRNLHPPHRASTDLVDMNGNENDNIAQVTSTDMPLFAQDNDLGSAPILHLLCKPKSTGVNQMPHINASKSKPETNRKSPQESTLRALGRPEDIIRCHSSYFRIHGHQPKRSLDDIISKDESTAINDKAFASCEHSERNEKDIQSEISLAKSKLLSSLKGNASLSNNPNFHDAVATLEKLYQSRKQLSAIAPPDKKLKSNPSHTDLNPSIDGTWQMISPPSYPACVGVNKDGEKMFTLGRMAFDMFQPANLVCSIQKQYNTIKTVTSDEKLPTYIPPSLRREAEQEHKKNSQGSLKAHK